MVAMVNSSLANGQPGESAPPVNLAAVREAGPGSQTKPFCDGTHAKIGFRGE